MRYLVTGATGFIGGAVARRVLDEGDELHVLARDVASPRLETLTARGTRVFAGDVGDPVAIAAAAAQCEAVIHAAGTADPRASVLACQWLHVAGTENVLAAARHAKVRRCVVLSSANVTLRRGARINWNEERTLGAAPLGALARSKLLAEELALSFGSKDFEITAIRPAWTWGRGDFSRFPHLVTEALAGGIHLIGSGATFFDSIHIDSLVDAVLAAAEETKAAGRTYYIADGAMESARAFFTMLSTAADLPPPRPGLPFEVTHVLTRMRRAMGASGLDPVEAVERGFDTLFDTLRARAELHWEPRTDRARALADFRAWITEQGGAAHVAQHTKPAPTDQSVRALMERADEADRHDNHPAS